MADRVESSFDPTQSRTCHVFAVSSATSKIRPRVVFGGPCVTGRLRSSVCAILVPYNSIRQNALPVTWIRMKDFDICKVPVHVWPGARTGVVTLAFWELGRVAGVMPPELLEDDVAFTIVVPPPPLELAGGADVLKTGTSLPCPH